MKKVSPWNDKTKVVWQNKQVQRSDETTNRTRPVDSYQCLSWPIYLVLNVETIGKALSGLNSMKIKDLSWYFVPMFITPKLSTATRNFAYQTRQVWHVFYDRQSSRPADKLYKTEFLLNAWCKQVEINTTWTYQECFLNIWISITVHTPVQESVGSPPNLDVYIVTPSLSTTVYLYKANAHIEM